MTAASPRPVSSPASAIANRRWHCGSPPSLTASGRQWAGDARRARRAPGARAAPSLRAAENAVGAPTNCRGAGARRRRPRATSAPVRTGWPRRRARRRRSTRRRGSRDCSGGIRFCENGCCEEQAKLVKECRVRAFHDATLARSLLSAHPRFPWRRRRAGARLLPLDPLAPPPPATSLPMVRRRRDRRRGAGTSGASTGAAASVSPPSPSSLPRRRLPARLRRRLLRRLHALLRGRGRRRERGGPRLPSTGGHPTAGPSPAPPTARARAGRQRPRRREEQPAAPRRRRPAAARPARQRRARRSTASATGSSPRRRDAGTGASAVGSPIPHSDRHRALGRRPPPAAADTARASGRRVTQQLVGRAAPPAASSAAGAAGAAAGGAGGGRRRGGCRRRLRLRPRRRRPLLGVDRVRRRGRLSAAEREHVLERLSALVARPAGAAAAHRPTPAGRPGGARGAASSPGGGRLHAQRVRSPHRRCACRRRPARWAAPAGLRRGSYWRTRGRIARTWFEFCGLFRVCESARFKIGCSLQLDCLVRDRNNLPRVCTKASRLQHAYDRRALGGGHHALLRGLLGPCDERVASGVRP